MPGKNKVLVLFSGGLDSLLAVELLSEQGADVAGVFFRLPFSCLSVPEFRRGKLHVVDCTGSSLLEEYLDMLRAPRYARGAGINPCIDCRIFMLRRAQELAETIHADSIATGEVAGQRPLSQTRNALELIDREVKGIRRPLMEIGIRGRRRSRQIELADKFKIDCPNPGGGCLLCEKELAPRFEFLLCEDLITRATLPLARIGRHFRNQCWFVVGRNKEESEIIDSFRNSIRSGKGTPGVYFHEDAEANRCFALRLQKAYQERDCEGLRAFRL
ncbi:hypothetical protein ACFL01_00735 [Planctomycetota bacterium]